MSPRRIIFLVIALVASGATIFIGRAWLSAERNARTVVQQVPAPQKPATMVLVARGDLHAGQFVRPENLRWQSWPDDNVPTAYVLSGQHQLEDYVGWVVRSAIADGEPITAARIVSPRDQGFLAAVLTPGYRAMTVALSPATDNAGFIFPGDHVDVLANLTLQYDDPVTGNPNASSHHVSETVLSDLRVLAIDQKADDQNKDVTVAKTATLEVTPKQAEILSVVGDMGKLSLSLRSLAQDESETVAENTHPALSYTFDSEATQLVKPPALAGTLQKITVVRGSAVTATEFHR